MSSSEIYRAKAEELLRQATAAENLAERSRLISEAVHWHAMADMSADATKFAEDTEKMTKDFGPDPSGAEEP